MLCDEKMSIECMDEGKIKSDIEEYLLSINGVSRIEIGRAVMDYEGYDKRRFIVVYLRNRVRSKFVKEEIGETPYSFLVPYLTFEWEY